MDERELQTLFKGVPGDPPPATFDTDDVLAGSARATARHRMRLATGGAIAALVLAGGGALGVQLLSEGNQDGGQAASAREDSGQPDGPVVRPYSGGPENGPASTSMQGDEGARLDRSKASSTLGCETVDRELAVALAGELPVTPQGDPKGGFLPCARGGNAGYLLTDSDGDRGWVSVSYYRPGEPQPRMASKQGPMSGRGSYDLREARTASGGLIMVLSYRPEGGEAPLTEDLQRIADRLAEDR